MTVVTFRDGLVLSGKLIGAGFMYLAAVVIMFSFLPLFKLASKFNHRRFGQIMQQEIANLVVISSDTLIGKSNYTLRTIIPYGWMND